MARPRGKINVVCLNEKCRYYLKEKGKNIVKREVSTPQVIRDIIAIIVKHFLWKQKKRHCTINISENAYLTMKANARDPDISAKIPEIGEGA